MESNAYSVYTGRVKHISHFILFILASSLSVLLMNGCGVRSSLDLSADNADVLSLDLEITGIALQYFEDISAAQGISLDGSSIFIPDQIRAFFDGTEGVTALDVHTEGTGGLKTVLAFDDINAFFAKESLPGIPHILSIIQEGQHKRLRIVFERGNINQLSALLPLGEDPVSQSGLMLFENHGTREEFIDMMDWLFEEYANRQEVEKTLKQSLIELEIKLPSDVLSTNMKKNGKRSVSLSVPMLEFFTLEEPLEYFAVY